MKFKKLSSNGMISKWVCEEGEDSFLFKDSLYKYSKEPIAEYICSEIAKNIGLNFVEYSLEGGSLLPGKTKSKYLSKCKIDTDIIRIVDLIEANGFNDCIYEDSEFLKLDIIKKYRKSFFEMFIFDSIIANPDRHFGNIHLNRKGFVILDNGQAFSSMNSFEYYNSLDSCQPFRSFHEDQIKFLEKELDLSRYESQTYRKNNELDLRELLSKILYKLLNKNIIDKSDFYNIKNIFDIQFNLIFGVKNINIPVWD